MPSKDKSFTDVQAASIKVIVGFIQAIWPELTERDIKEIDPVYARVIPYFWRIALRKKRGSFDAATFVAEWLRIAFAQFLSSESQKGSAKTVHRIAKSAPVASRNLGIKGERFYLQL